MSQEADGGPSPEPSDAAAGLAGESGTGGASGPKLRVCIVGDELTAGVGDEHGLGWVGRIATRTLTNPPAEFYPLAVPGERLHELAERWPAETERRFERGHDNRLVLALGRADLADGTSAMRSRLTFANCLDTAIRRKVPTIVVGPPPLASLADRELARVNDVYAEVAGRRGITYIDTFNSLLGDERWQQDLIQSGNPWPRRVGYGLLAWLVLNGGWYDWLDLEPVYG